MENRSLLRKGPVVFQKVNIHRDRVGRYLYQAEELGHMGECKVPCTRRHCDGSRMFFCVIQ
ncbi:hypothetical protein Mapa_008029 [Marchantia paleacea]|nr:hypothetical protein Mapa_008029 [Marchantia paleacea]